MQLINIKYVILVDWNISRNVSIPLDQDWRAQWLWIQAGMEHFPWVMFCYKRKGTCNSWKDLSCLAADEVWRTNIIKTCMFPVYAPLQCCWVAAVTSRALSRIDEQGPECPCLLLTGPSHKQSRDLLNFPKWLRWTRMSQIPLPVATVLCCSSRSVL